MPRATRRGRRVERARLTVVPAAPGPRGPDAVRDPGRLVLLGGVVGLLCSTPRCSRRRSRPPRWRTRPSNLAAREQTLQMSSRRCATPRTGRPGPGGWAWSCRRARARSGSPPGPPTAAARPRPRPTPRRCWPRAAEEAAGARPRPIIVTVPPVAGSGTGGHHGHHGGRGASRASTTRPAADPIRTPDPARWSHSSHQSHPHHTTTTETRETQCPATASAARPPGPPRPS